MRYNQFYFGNILPETSKSSAFWDMGVDPHLKWLLLFSPDVALVRIEAPVYYMAEAERQSFRVFRLTMCYSFVCMSGGDT